MCSSFLQQASCGLDLNFDMTCCRDSVGIDSAVGSSNGASILLLAPYRLSLVRLILDPPHDPFGQQQQRIHQQHHMRQAKKNTPTHDTDTVHIHPFSVEHTLSLYTSLHLSSFLPQSFHYLYTIPHTHIMATIFFQPHRAQSLFRWAIPNTSTRVWQPLFWQPLFWQPLFWQQLGSTALLWEDDDAIWSIKRTYQPSIQRKRRKTGFLRRQESVGGRRVLNRRRHKGRIRLGGC